MRHYLLITVVVLVSSLILGGCASPAQVSAPAPAPATAPSPAPALSSTPAQKPAPAPAPAPSQPQTKPIKLTLAMSSPEIGWVSKSALRPWIKQVTDATNGRVQFDVYYSQGLAKQNEVWQAVESGVADVGFIVHMSYPGLTPVTDMVTLPFLTLDTAKKNSAVFWKMYEKTPAIQKEYAPHHVLMTWCSPPSFLGSTKKQVKTVNDLKGMKVKVGGGLPVTQAFKAFGASPIIIAAADSYMAVQRNTIEAMGLNWDMMMSYKFYEILKYYTYSNLYSGHFAMVMNSDKWNGLPKDIKDALNGKAGLAGSEFMGYNQFDAAEAPAREEITKGGYQMIEYKMSQDEIDKMVELGGKPAWDEWVKSMKAKGIADAEQILNTMLELQKTYR